MKGCLITVADFGSNIPGLFCPTFPTSIDDELQQMLQDPRLDGINGGTTRGKYEMSSH